MLITCCWLPEIFLAFAWLVTCHMLTAGRTGRDGSRVDLVPCQWSGHSDWTTPRILHVQKHTCKLSWSEWCVWWSCLMVCIPTAPVLHKQHPSGCILHPYRVGGSPCTAEPSSPGCWVRCCYPSLVADAWNPEKEMCYLRTAQASPISPDHRVCDETRDGALISPVWNHCVCLLKSTHS